MPTQEELKSAQATLEAKQKIEEIVGSSVGTVTMYSSPTDEEYEKAYAEMYEKKSKHLKNLKKYRPLGFIAAFLAVIGVFAIIMLGVIFDWDTSVTAVLATLLFVAGVGVLSCFVRKSWEPPTKEEYFNETAVESAKKWIKEAEKNSYYFDDLQKALTEKYAFAKIIKGPLWRLLIGDTKFTVLLHNRNSIFECVSFQIENISGITIQKQVEEQIISVSTENKLYNKYNGSTLGNKFTTETNVSRSTEYLVSFSFSNRINPYSIYVGTDNNLLLSVVNLFEQMTGLQARYI